MQGQLQKVLVTKVPCSHLLIIQEELGCLLICELSQCLGTNFSAVSNKATVSSCNEPTRDIWVTQSTMCRPQWVQCKAFTWT